MLPGEQAFLDRIVAHPDDATARLVYADWLEENGDPDRARYLRYKVGGLKFLDMPTNVNDQLDLLREVNDRGVAAVLAAFPKPLAPYLKRTDLYQKGMLARVAATGHEELSHLADHAAELLAVAPVRELVLAAEPDRGRCAAAVARLLAALPPGRAEVTVAGPFRGFAEALLAGPELNRVTALSVGSPFGNLDAAADALIRCPHFSDAVSVWIENLGVAQRPLKPGSKRRLRERFGPRVRWHG